MKKLTAMILAGAVSLLGFGGIADSAQAQAKKDKMSKEMMMKDKMSKEKMMMKDKMSKEMMMKDKMKPPFGQKNDVAYSKALWKAMAYYRLVGPKSVRTKPYEGTEPHGVVLETYSRRIRVKGRTGLVIIKKNYGPKGVDVDTIAEGGGKLGAVTVMFKRSGYDKDNADWFWVKYKGDGSLHTNPKGMMLAGRVAKGKDKGCISCHKNAPGDDFVFAPFVR